MSIRRLVALPVLAALVLLAEVVWAMVVGSSVPYAPPSPGLRRAGDAGRPTTRFVVLGDSTAAGQGAPFAEGIASAAARELAREGRHVVWYDLAVSGERWSGVEQQQLAAATRLRPDVVLVSAGANDVTHGTSGGSVRSSVAAVVAGLRRANREVRVLVTGVPDMGSTPRLPQPLRWLAGERAKSLDGVVREEGARSGVPVIPILQRTGPAFRRDHGLFSRDGFHPNARGYALWSAVIAESLARR